MCAATHERKGFQKVHVRVYINFALIVVTYTHFF